MANIEQYCDRCSKRLVTFYNIQPDGTCEHLKTHSAPEASQMQFKIDEGHDGVRYLHPICPKCGHEQPTGITSPG
ncbi:MAG TPA: hypothetical protein VGN72_09435 [Tepidisphaeraceae bacterium]|jgi:hypothetical protein|nr:hypothetical protein [Tepidisphaeraceae bacterium]